MSIQIDNLSTGMRFDAITSAGQYLTEIHASPGHGSAVGDVLSAGAGSHPLFLIHGQQITDRHRSFSLLSCLSANKQALITRNGRPIAEPVAAHASKVGPQDDKFGALLRLAARPGSPLLTQHELAEHLTAAAAHLHDNKELQAAILQHLDRYQQTSRIIIRSGSGASIGDVVPIDGQPAGTISGIDRTTWSGLEILSCSQLEQPAAATTKPKSLKSLFTI